MVMLSVLEIAVEGAVLGAMEALLSPLKQTCMLRDFFEGQLCHLLSLRLNFRESLMASLPGITGCVWCLMEQYQPSNKFRHNYTPAQSQK